MTVILKLLVVTLLYIPSSNCADCYWKGWPWCGLIFLCSGNDHHMQYGFTVPCLISPDKYCCPAGSGADIALCEHKDLGGHCISHSIEENECATVDKSDWASSVNTFGGCFRLYEHDGCQGKSVAVQPGSPSHDNLEDLGMNDLVTSVSLCFSTDTCDHRSKRSSNNNCQFASEILTLGFLPWLTRDTNNLNGPVNYYQIGPNSRTEVMEALIYPHHLGTGTATNQAARNYATNMGNSNDDAGHILAQRLGGSGTDLRNIFPQSRNINRGVWAQVEGMVDQVVRLHGSAYFTVNLEYHSRSDTRPYQIIFRIRSGDHDWSISDMVNPD